MAVWKGRSKSRTNFGLVLVKYGQNPFAGLYSLSLALFLYNGERHAHQLINNAICSPDLYGNHIDWNYVRNSTQMSPSSWIDSFCHHALAMGVQRTGPSINGSQTIQEDKYRRRFIVESRQITALPDAGIRVRLLTGIDGTIFSLDDFQHSKSTCECMSSNLAVIRARFDTIANGPDVDSINTCPCTRPCFCQGCIIRVGFVDIDPHEGMLTLPSTIVCCILTEI